MPVDELYALVTSTHTYADLPRSQLENVLDMLDGRYPSSEFAELRPRIIWDRIKGTIRARPGARQLAVINAGTIPDRGLYAVTLPDGRRVGELDEEMVYESRPGQTFLLGASTWRIEEITRDRVIVTPAPGLPGAVPFWKGDGVGRPKELGEAIGAFARWAAEQSPSVLERDYDLDQRAATNLVDFLQEQQAATRVVPSDRAIVVERFRDEIGDWRLCVLSPFGGRVHSAWALALSARIRDELGLESDAIYSDDGIIVHLPDAEEPPTSSLVLLEPDEVEERVVAELGSSALFGARFRENAARALLIPARAPGQAHAALATAAEIAVAAGGRQAGTASSRSCWRPTASACATCSTSPGWSSCSAACGGGRSRWSRSRLRPPRRSRRACCSTTSRPTCTKATRPTPSAARRHCRWTATCCASCWARRSSAT